MPTIKMLSYISYTKDHINQYDAICTQKGTGIQLNLVNSESCGLEVLFRSIESSFKLHGNIYRNILNPKIIVIIFPIKHMFWVRKRNVSGGSFYAPKT